MDELGIHTLDVGQHQQLLNAGVISHIAVKPGVGIAPLPCSLAEEGHVQEIALAGVGDGGLCRGDESGNEVRLDRVGVDAVVKLGNSAIEVPREQSRERGW